MRQTSNPHQKIPPAQPIRLHRAAVSGHCHRVEMLLSMLGLPHELVDVNLRAGEHKKPEFLALNPFGQVPVLQDGVVTLADSNAMLVYLVLRYAPESSHWLPAEPLHAAEVQRWLSVAAGQLAFGPAAARKMVLFNIPGSTDEAIARAHALFGVMEQQLARSPFLAGQQPTLADIANYSYTARAPEGGVSLQSYPHLQAWLARVEALPGFVPMVKTPVGLPA